MQVKDAMNPKVIVANDDISVKEAARLMAKFKIGSLVIIEEGKGDIIGVITESDIVRKVVATGLDSSQTLVEQTMTKEVITVDEDIDLGEACQIMVENKIKRLPVLEDGELVGILTTTDVMAVEPKLIEELAKVMLFSEKQMIAG
ncbi:MAG: CBS domain-containing protein [Candidatus Aenigmarchaeota archaeon]|nr:CBS domain-containing protein [Candidatus Aenigmarchaeota archaeon]